MIKLFDEVIIDFDEIEKDKEIEEEWIEIMKEYFKDNKPIVIRHHNKGKKNESYDVTIEKDLDKSVGDRQEFKFFTRELFEKIVL